MREEKSVKTPFQSNVYNNSKQLKDPIDVPLEWQKRKKKMENLVCKEQQQQQIESKAINKFA